MELNRGGNTALSNNKYLHVSICMLALLFCVLLTRPYVSMGVGDDWSYIWSARVLANTGHLTYNGWGAMPLGWFAYLGALFIKLFGFSFTIVRSSGMVVSMLCAALMQRIFVRTGASEGMATIATLSLVLSPLFLPLSFSLMTDIPALFVLVLCIYCCLRALQATSNEQILAWITFAALSSMIGGTVRQTAWLGVLLLVPSTVWCIRRRKVFLIGAALWGIGVLGIALYLHWFHTQPYAVVDKVFYRYHAYSVLFAASLSLTSLACLLPILCAFLVRHPAGQHSARNIAAIAGAIGGSVLFWGAITSHKNYFSHFKDIPFGVIGNYLTAEGVFFGPILGDSPKVVPLAVRFLLTIATLSALSSFGICFVRARHTLFGNRRRATLDRYQYPYVSNSHLIMLLFPFTAVYAFLIATRSIVYDRYFLPLQFVFALGLIRVYRQTISERIPRPCLILGLVFAAYGVASTHDLYTFYRARVDATKEITATGIPRTAIEGGLEYDGWTQLEETGYVNDPRILFPRGAYHAWVPPNEPSSCIGWIRQFTPSVHPLLYISHSPDNCYSPSQFAPVTYENWLPPRRRTIYILASH
ncbi:MAG: ArnT family glycosyltransferase [Edaphobacter sp.]